jgi:uncharacterized membrane protein HdeD (DUF308 family)
MTEGQLIGTIIGISNVFVGALLSAFFRPIGSGMSVLGKRTRMDKMVGTKLYEERFSQKFVLVVGIWLIVWGIIAFLLIPALTGGNPQPQIAR